MSQSGDDPLLTYGTATEAVLILESLGYTGRVLHGSVEELNVMRECGNGLNNCDLTAGSTYLALRACIYTGGGNGSSPGYVAYIMSLSGDDLSLMGKVTVETCNVLLALDETRSRLIGYPAACLVTLVLNHSGLELHTAVHALTVLYTVGRAGCVNVGNPLSVFMSCGAEELEVRRAALRAYVLDVSLIGTRGLLTIYLICIAYDFASVTLLAYGAGYENERHSEYHYSNNGNDQSLFHGEISF